MRQQRTGEFLEVLNIASIVSVYIDLLEDCSTSGGPRLNGHSLNLLVEGGT